MRRKLVDQHYKLPYFVANPISRIGEPQANEDDVDTAAEIITNYLQTDHDGYVRPLHILVCGANPRAVKAVVERMTYWQDDLIYRADGSCVGRCVAAAQNYCVGSDRQCLRLRVPVHVG